LNATRSWGAVRNRAIRISGIAAAATVVVWPSAAGADSFEGPTPHVMSSPEMVASNAVSLAMAGATEAELQSPGAIIDRLQSAEAFADLSAEDAQDLAAESFSALLGRPTWEPPSIPAGMEIVDYQGKTSAVVAPVGADARDEPPATYPAGEVPELGPGGAVIQSTLPIRARSDSGSLEPVNSALEDHGDFVQPANSTVEAQIPDELSDGIQLPELDVSLTPYGAPSASDAELIGTDKLFYSGVADDTDFIASPTPIGVETFLQLRSAESPESQHIRVEVPSGGNLKEADDGQGAIINDNDGPVATVLPPVAVDSDGTPVPVSMTTKGSSLALDIQHQGAGFRYPILVDPVTQSYDWSTSGATCPGPGTGNTPGWWFETTQPSKFAAAPCALVFGVMNMNNANQTFAANDYSQWIWKPPLGASIQSATFGNTVHSALTSCSTMGIYNPATQSWQASNLSDYGRCSSWSNVNKTYSIGSTGVDNNLAVTGLSFPTAGTRTGSAWTSASSASFTLYDTHAPTFTSTPPSDGAWIDDTEGATTHQYNHALAASDQGLGVKTFWFLTPSTADGTQLTVQTATRSCAGAVGAGSCTSPSSAWSSSFTYKLPEGENQSFGLAFDNGGTPNAQPYSWTQRIDRSAPQISQSGTLANAANNAAVEDGTYALHAVAVDGSTTSSALMRSGVTDLTVKLDGQEVAGVHQACPSGSCSRTLDYELDTSALSRGDHTLTTVATDALDHSTTVTKHFANTIDSPPDVALSGGLALGGGGEGDLYIHATDGPGFASSGIASVRLVVDGAPWSPAGTETVSPGATCDATMCSYDTDFAFWPANLASGPHAFTVQVDDGAGHTTTKQWYEWFSPQTADSVPAGDGPGEEVAETDLRDDLCGSAYANAANGPPSSGEGVVDRMPVAHPQGDLEEVATATFPTKFGGIWIDRSSCPSQYVVTLVNASATQISTMTAALANSPTTSDAPYRVETVPASEADLAAASDAVTDELLASNTGTFMTSGNLADEAVTVYLQDALDVGVRTDVEGAAGGAAAPGSSVPVDYVVDPTFEPPELALDPRFKGLPYKAGGLIQFGSKFNIHGGCTSGFVAKKGHNSVGLTAGHCLQGESRVWNGAPDLTVKFIGKKIEDAWDGNGSTRVDAGDFNIPEDKATRKILVTNGGKTRTVVAKFHNTLDYRSYKSLGYDLCFQGMGTIINHPEQHDHCGPIVDLNVNFHKGGATVRHQTCIGVTGHHGDSGGPVYRPKVQDGQAVAAGITTSKGDIRTHSPISGLRTVLCFTRIDRVEDRLNVDVATG